MSLPLADTFSALADPTRLEVIALLRESPRSSSALADALETSRPTMSRHLTVLRRAGLVAEEIQAEDARVRLYHLRHEPIADVRSWVDELEGYWTDQLTAFRNHVANRKKGPKKGRKKR